MSRPSPASTNPARLIFSGSSRFQRSRRVRPQRPASPDDRLQARTVGFRGDPTMFDVIWRAVAIGIGATMLMDLWAIFLHKAFGQPRPNWGPVGRWVWHLGDKVFHDDIGAAEPYAHEV